MANGGVSGYAGKVTNKSAQVVKAVYSQPNNKGSKVIKGEDLRTKKSK